MKIHPLPRRPLGVICALALLALTSVAQAQWKWKDADGRVQYSDRPPPPGVADKDILQRPSNAQRIATQAQPAAIAASDAASAASAPGRPASEVSSREKVERERKAQEDKARADVMAENCRQAQTQMRMLESGVRMRTGAPGGESQPMTDAMRADKMRQMQTMISTNCK
ncbi:DUF4124 domain-containing protein [Mitsuaria sp. GD03876]|uniref:DUF4124 domain-containing protein n=1 Tax=Mitsuaria sp. GD03876 TaxID=2975399 RepID=UPI002449AC7B|nr:DUF4124 domain-containing protein [Mitsuaria sp. GD03876]MDH0866423.1 DUF4124 domain-containing protein [Mitsuaria sp. GD03876]